MLVVFTFNTQVKTWYFFRKKLVKSGVKNRFTLERCGRDERHREGRRKGVYTTGTAVCASQMGIKLRQSRGTVPLWVDPACTIFPRHRRIDHSEHRCYLLRIDFCFRGLGQGQTWWSSEFKSAFSLVAAYLTLRNSAGRIGVLLLDHQKLTPAWRPFWAVFKWQPYGFRLCYLHLRGKMHSILCVLD